MGENFSTISRLKGKARGFCQAGRSWGGLILECLLEDGLQGFRFFGEFTLQVFQVAEGEHAPVAPGLRLQAVEKEATTVSARAWLWFAGAGGAGDSGSGDGP
jgi:hypothetical protein